MNKKWKLAGAAIALAVAIPVSAYAAADGASQKNPDKKYHVISINKSGVKSERKDARIDVLDIAVKKLGLDKAAIEAAAKDGKSLNDLAKEKGIAIQPIIDELTAQLVAEIQKARSSEGQLTDEEKNNINLKVSTELNRVVTVPLSEQMKEDKGHAVYIEDHGGSGIDIAELAVTKFGLDKAAFEKAVKDGKSLTDLAKEKGIAIQPIIDELTKQLLASIQKPNDAEKLTAEEKSNITKKVGLEAKRIVTEPLAEQLKAAKRERVYKEDHGGVGVDVAQIAITKFGLDKEAYEKAAKAGKSLGDLAKEKGIAIQPIIDEVTNQIMSGMQNPDDSEKLTDEDKSNRKKKINFEANRIVNEPLNKQMSDDKYGLNIKAAIVFLGLDKAALEKFVNSGKSLTEIAKDKGFTRQQLIDALLIDVDAQLKKLVDNKQLTQIEADQEKKEARAFVDKFVDEKLSLSSNQKK
ncbi:hypothetical protein [Paenibacillus sp. CF384]|uniref:hypothetical protein n=1 Tax=Paenibacillus sp. CF384 TaxID=1884382 RepID=UPI000899E0D6|nr:hypothetical protein [Paenibacillus sp. CF384]SDX13100.1 hypothetical protein SAMN05518855_100964 [Paenibacillus sp. CF384]